MTGDKCKAYTIGNYEVQENGIVRGVSGVIIGRLRDLEKSPETSEADVRLNNLLNACQSLERANGMLNNGLPITSTEEMEARQNDERNAIRSVIDAFGKIGI